MAWTPSIQVFDERAAKNAVIDYIKSVQTEALAWANGGYGPPQLTPIRAFHKVPSTVTVFPAITIIQTEHESVFDHILAVQFSMTFEIAITHGDQDTLTDLSARYAMAFESMLVNLPETTFSQDSIIDITSTIRGLDTVFGVQGKVKSKFIQLFQTRAVWTIEAAAYAD